MSTLVEELERYIAIRRSLGFELVEEARILKRFAAFADAQGADHITTDLFLRWKDGFGMAGTGNMGETTRSRSAFCPVAKGLSSKDRGASEVTDTQRRLPPHPPLYLQRVGNRVDYRRSGAVTIVTWHSQSNIQDAVQPTCRHRPAN